MQWFCGSKYWNVANRNETWNYQNTNKESTSIKVIYLKEAIGHQHLL